MLVLKKHRITQTAGIVILLCMLFLPFMSCKTSDEDLSATIYVNNQCGKALDIFMDGNFQFLLEYELSATIESIAFGLHQFEAKIAGTDTQVSSVEVEITSGGEYDWTIQGPSTITITNAYGETLQIYMNGSYLGDIEDTADQTIGSVTFGEHSLEAMKEIDNETAASITIDVTEIKEYFWIITK
jgi:hypothetical protein